MTWIGLVSSIVTAAFPERRGQRVDTAAPIVPPPGLEGARVAYVNEGRSGRVVFSQGLKTFDMYFEFGGGDTLAIIDVPSETEWGAKTGIPVAMRAAILEFVGQSVVRDQTSGGRGRFEVGEASISVYVCGAEYRSGCFGNGRLRRMPTALFRERERPGTHTPMCYLPPSPRCRNTSDDVRRQ